ncbi:MAG: methyltransferase domain-containing protein [Ignavibacteriales bacterium]|nr:methyltransferase domain-containing protein [Ignavibacteriales bacterium]
MDPTTDRTAPAADFYDALSYDYDTMTEFDRRFVRERPFFHMFVEKYNIGSAVDAGCGTGFHSLLLAQLGVRVTAVDISSAMLEQVRGHAKRMNLSVNIMQEEFQSLATSVREKVDGVFCLGNSLAHLLSKKNLRLSISNFFKVLKPGGILFLQNLNYDRILKERERIQSVKEVKGKTFVRLYEYGKDDITFTIQTIERPNGIPVQSQRSVRLRPLLREELFSLVAGAGFIDVKPFGSIALDNFDPAESKDLVLIARKPEDQNN